MVFSRWAIVRTVQSANSLRMVFWIRSSVSKSTAAVASSRTKILVLRSKARARHTNWRWPTLMNTNISYLCINYKYNLRFSPPSATGYSNPSGNPWTNLLRWAVSKDLQISSSVVELNGSTLIRRVPENRTGSYKELICYQICSNFIDLLQKCVICIKTIHCTLKNY